MVETAERRPILVSIPHAGAEVPPGIAEKLALKPEELRRYTDLYTEQIYGIDDVYRVESRVSRVIVDVNRAPDDISHEYERAAEGVTVLTTWDGKSVYKKELDEKTAAFLISEYHDAFHQRIEECMPYVKFLIDGHSYLPFGPKLKPYSGEMRPDINIGNMNYSTCTREHTVFVREFFETRGYSVRINFPYTGKYILGHHCHRRRIPPFLVPGLQLEINQGLYVKPETDEPIPERITEFRTLFEMLVDAFMMQFLI